MKRITWTVLALLLTVSLGLLSRLYPLGWRLYDKSLGDVLYAVAAYLALALVWYRRPAWLIGVGAGGWCLAVELFKLTEIPAQHAHLAVVRWLVGTTFSWHNLGCYVLGVLTIMIIDARIFRRRCGPGDEMLAPGSQHAAPGPIAPV